MKKNIVAISGSTRKNSSNEIILQTIKERFKETTNIEVVGSLAGLPHFDPDPYPESLPPAVTAFRDLIEKADGVIICSPEYVFSLPAVLKNALEWVVATTIFTEKPVALIVASASGEKALGQLILIMKTLQAKIDDKATLLLQGARSKVSGGEITDVQTLQDIDALVHSFLSAME